LPERVKFQAGDHLWVTGNGDRKFVEPQNSKKSALTLLQSTAVEWIPAALRIVYSCEISCFPPAMKRQRLRSSSGRLAWTGPCVFRGKKGATIDAVRDANVAMFSVGCVLLRVTDIPSMPRTDASGLRQHRRTCKAYNRLRARTVMRIQKQGTDIPVVISALRKDMTRWILGDTHMFGKRRDPKYFLPYMDDLPCLTRESHPDGDATHFMGSVPPEQFGNISMKREIVRPPKSLDSLKRIQSAKELPISELVFCVVVFSSQKGG